MIKFLKTGLLSLSFVLITTGFAIDVEEIEALYRQDINQFNQIVLDLLENEESFEGEERYRFLYVKAMSLKIKGLPQLAIQNLHEVVEETSDQELKYKAIINLLNSNYTLGEFEEAFQYGLQLQTPDYLNIPQDSVQRGKLNLALALIESGLANEASELIIPLYKNASDANAKCLATGLIAEMMLNHELELVEYEELVAMKKWCLDSKQMLYGHLIETRLTAVLIAEEKFEQALEELTLKEAEILDFNYDSLSVGWLANLSKVHAILGNTERAIEYAVKTEDYELALNDRVTRMWVFGALAETYSLAGNYKKAFEYKKAYHEVYENSIKRQMAASLAYSAATVQAAQREQEISLLNQRNQLLEKDAELAKSQAANARFYFFVPVIIAIVLVGILLRLTLLRNHLKSKAVYDKSTKAFSNTYFDEVTGSALKHAHAQEEDVGLILFDIDNLKIIRDTHGESAGEWVIQHVVLVTKQVLRKNDIFGRVNEGEFAITLPGCDTSNSQQIAEKIQNALSKIDTADTGALFDISACFGITSSKVSGFERKALRSDAKIALVDAKVQGPSSIVVKQGSAKSSRI